MNEKSLNNSKIIKIFTDGAARGNPGPAASSFIIVEDRDIIKKGSEFIGTATNNIAEYKAIILALKSAKKFIKNPIQVYSDSNLAIQQINGNWKINVPHLLELHKTVIGLVKDYKKVEFIHVNRENKYIQKCDKACNIILNKKAASLK